MWKQNAPQTIFAFSLQWNCGRGYFPWKSLMGPPLIPPLVQPRPPPLSGLIRYASYQADDASYTQIGFVTDWNKKEWADSIDGFSSFPDSADKDHDGIVYLLTNAKGKKNAIDAADLKKWVDSYRKGAKEIPHHPIKDSNNCHYLSL